MKFLYVYDQFLCLLFYKQNKRMKIPSYDFVIYYEICLHKIKSYMKKRHDIG